MTHQHVKPVPEGMRTVTPHLVCGGAADAIEFYKQVAHWLGSGLEFYQ